VPSSLENERDGGGLFEGEILGEGEAVNLRAAHELGAAAVDHVTEIGKLRAIVVAAGQASGAFAASDSRSEENLLAWSDGGHSWADFFDGAGDIAAGNVRKRNRNAGEAAADPEVEMVESAGVDADEDFAGAGFGFGDVGVAEDVGAAVAVKEDGFHGRGES